MEAGVAGNIKGDMGTLPPDWRASVIFLEQRSYNIPRAKEL
jgi:hypothetical protein